MTTNSPKQLHYLTGTIRRDISILMTWHFAAVNLDAKEDAKDNIQKLNVSTCTSACACMAKASPGGYTTTDLVQLLLK